MANELKWKRVITTFCNDNDEPYVHDETIPVSAKPYEYDGVLISRVEIPSKLSSGKCPTCGKPFVLGDIVINHKFQKRTIVFLSKHLAYFGESYEGDDSLDIVEQTRYLVHASHVREAQFAEYARGQKAWHEGMEIVRKVSAEVFKNNL